MNLDDIAAIQGLDSLNMLSELRGLPEQLKAAWKSGITQSSDLQPVRNVVIAGMGGSAIGADLAASYISPICIAPIIVLRDYTLPVWVRGKDTLVICSSHSGNTEETLAVFDQAVKSNCQIAVISTGGEISRKAKENGISIFPFTHHGQPRAAVGFSFGLLLAIFNKLKLIPDQTDSIEAAVNSMRSLMKKIDLESPISNNPAKRIAGQAVGRLVSVFAAEPLAPVARRWKTQINELSKSWAQFEFLPEADHNTLAGIFVPEEILSKVYAVFLTCAANHPRNALRLDKTRQEMLLNGLSTDSISFVNGDSLSQMWEAILFGDYVAYFLAAAYDMDPTPIEAIASLKKSMQ